MNLQTARQSVFDKVVKGLAKQRWRQSTRKRFSNLVTGEMCTYRGNDGLKCAIGQLIPDKVYTEDLEGEALLDVLVVIPRRDVKVLLASDDESPMFFALRELHDNYEDPKDMRDNYKAYAKEHGLKWPKGLPRLR